MIVLRPLLSIPTEAIMDLFMSVLTGLGLAALSVALLLALAAVSDSPLIGPNRMLAGADRVPRTRRHAHRAESATRVDEASTSASASTARAASSSTIRRPAHAASRASSPARTAGHSSMTTE